MKLPKGFPGSKEFELQELQKRKMKEAFDLELELETKTATVSNKKVSVTFTAKPTMTRLELKENCGPSDILKAINECLDKVHTIRDQMARDLIERG